MIKKAIAKYNFLTEQYPFWAKLARFVISGGSATLVNLLVLTLLTEVFRVWYLFSSIVAFLFAFFTSFALQKFWTFRDFGKEKIYSQAVIYLLIVVLGLLTNTVLVYLLVEKAGFHYILGQVVAGIFIAIMNYFLYQKFVFGSTNYTARISDFIFRNKREIIFCCALMAVFLATRLPGLSLPYHQDEWKNASAAGTMTDAGNFFAHPPLMQILFVLGSNIFGFDNLRAIPFLFSFLAAILLYILVRNRYGKSTAYTVSLLSSLSFYSVWGSLQLDVDGSVLPFFFLLAAIIYDKIRRDNIFNKKLIAVFVVVLLLGWLTKLSFILVIGAFFLDFVLDPHRKLDFRTIGWSSIGLVALVGVYVGLLFSIQAVYPDFRIAFMLRHAQQYSEAGRNYIQIIVQAMKAFFYLSPLLLAPLIFFTKEIFYKAKLFIIYLFAGFLFYFLIFDFSRAALDKYLMFAIVPFAVVCGLILSENKIEIWNKKTLITGLVLSGALLTLNFISHEVLPLYPKTLWFSRVLRGEWRILNPFNGGSGPLGFYVSFAFIGASFLIVLGLCVAGRYKKRIYPYTIAIIFMLGISYNLVFAEELFFGKINGSTTAVLKKSMEFVESKSSIEKVITFNDIGAAELIKMKKYSGRIYATPEFEEGNMKKFLQFNGHFLIIEFPRLYEYYSDFFESCKYLFETQSGKIRGRVYDCGMRVTGFQK